MVRIRAVKRPDPDSTITTGRNPAYNPVPPRGWEGRGRHEQTRVPKGADQEVDNVRLCLDA